MEKDILLMDLGSIYWREWFATRSQIETMSKVIDRADFCARFYNCVIVCADSETNWRNRVTAKLDRDKQYKANRPKKAPEALLNLRAVEAKLEELGYPVIKCDGAEADDVIATLVDQNFDRSIHILSEDKDLYQLIDNKTTQLTRAGMIDTFACQRKFGVNPWSIADMLALVGDNSDNIEGCPGVGAKKAVSILRGYSTIEKAKKATAEQLCELDGISQRVAQNFIDWDPTMAQTLVSLKRDLDIDLDTILALYSARPTTEESEVSKW